MDGAQVRVFETSSGSFHPKVWLFRAANRQGAAIVGSSNLSRTALTSGVEWNLHAEGAADLVARAFEDPWTHPRTCPLTPDWIAAYAARRQGAPLTDLAQKIVADDVPAPPPEPHAIQRAALAALTATRAAGHRAGLVVLATGLGKTWLAAFDIHLFVRNGKLRNGKAAPFLYCGQPEFMGWEGEGPITVTWRLPLPVPEHLRPRLGIHE